MDLININKRLFFVVEKCVSYELRIWFSIQDAEESIIKCHLQFLLVFTLKSEIINSTNAPWSTQHFVRYASLQET
jgi:hypothetical protein